MKESELVISLIILVALIGWMWFLQIELWRKSRLLEIERDLTKHLENQLEGALIEVERVEALRQEAVTTVIHQKDRIDDLEVHLTFADQVRENLAQSKRKGFYE